MEYTREMLSPQCFYQFATATIQPRPIAWISTLQPEKNLVNLAPFSFFNIANINPPVLSVSIIHKAKNQFKDTLVNLERHPECVVNIVTVDLAEKMNQTCADYPADISELDCVGLASVPSQVVAVPGVAASPVRFECRVRQIIDFGDQPSAGKLVLLDVCHMTVVDSCLTEDLKIDRSQLVTVGRMGGNGYVTTAEPFDLVRPVLK